MRFGGISTVSPVFPEVYIFWYKQMSLVILFVLVLPFHSALLELTKLDLGYIPVVI